MEWTLHCSTCTYHVCLAVSHLNMLMSPSTYCSYQFDAHITAILCMYSVKYKYHVLCLIACAGTAVPLAEICPWTLYNLRLGHAVDQQSFGSLKILASKLCLISFPSHLTKFEYCNSLYCAQLSNCLSHLPLRSDKNCRCQSFGYLQYMIVSVLFALTEHRYWIVQTWNP